MDNILSAFVFASTTVIAHSKKHSKVL